GAGLAGGAGCRGRGGGAGRAVPRLAGGAAPAAARLGGVGQRRLGGAGGAGAALAGGGLSPLRGTPLSPTPHPLTTPPPPRPPPPPPPAGSAHSAAAGHPLGSFPRPLRRQRRVVRRAVAAGGVGEDRLAEARALRQLDVPPDARGEDPRLRPRRRRAAALVEV